MSIWFNKKNDLGTVNEFNKSSAIEQLGIIITEIGDDFLKGTMPVDQRTCQPYGILHGGASALMAESLGSVAGHLCVDTSKNVVVGININTSHLKPVKSGTVHGIASPIHIGKSTHVWEIKIYDEKDQLISDSRLTMAVVDAEKMKQKS